MYIAETNSTNTLMRSYLDEEDLFGIRTDFQTAGRGQMGNTWEAERGKNLLCSILWKRPMVPQKQFQLSQLLALAVVGAIEKTMGEYSDGWEPDRLTIKWPNDIYYGDKKLAGLLVENILQGDCIQRSILGVGLNVNQERFVSSAPNPVSLKQIGGKEYNVETVYAKILDEIVLLRELDEHQLRQRYMVRLYRRNGWWEYAEREVSVLPSHIQQHTEDCFWAELVDVTHEGCLQLRTKNNEIKTYHFKQIQFVI